MSRALDALTCDVLRRLSLHRWDAMVSFAGPSVTVTVYELSTHLGYRESGADLARTTLRAMRRAGLDEGESAALYAELGAAIDRAETDLLAITRRELGPALMDGLAACAATLPEVSP